MNFYNLLKVSQSFAQPGTTIQGPAVANLISSIKTMFGRGAPTQYDDTGFNKIDHSDPMLANMSYLPVSDTTPIQIKDAVRAVGMLMKYRKRQLPNWDALYKGIQELIDAKTGATSTKDLPSDKIVYRGKNKYGKLLFYIPNLGRKLGIIQKEIGNVSGNPRDAWKLFSAAKEIGLDIYQVDQNVIPIVVKMLFNYKYDTTDMAGAVEETKTQEPQETKPGEVEKPKQEVQICKKPIQKVELLYNGTLIISLGQWSDAWNRVIQELKKDNKIGYNKDGHARVFYEPNVQMVDAIINAIKNEFDVRQLEEIKGKLSAAPDKKAASDKGAPLQVENVMANTKDKWQLAFTFGQKGSREGEDLKDIIKFMFPQFGRDGQRAISALPSTKNPYDPTDQKDPDNPYKQPGEQTPGMWKYLIRGDYNQYRQVGATFKKYGFDVSQFNKIVAGLVNTGIVKPTRVEGDLDGYQREVAFTDAAGNKRKTKVNDNDRFVKELDGYKKKVIKDGKEIDFELYPLQKVGVAFLYGHKSALLGDATGSGKCLASGSWVQTSYGDFEIQDIWNNFSQNVSSEVADEEWADTKEKMYVHSIDEKGKVVKGEIEKLYREKFCGKMIKIITENGKEIISTKIHKFLTPFGWKNDLLEGDYICSSSNQFNICENKKIDKDLAYLLAWQISEGYESDKRAKVTIFQNDMEILDKIKDIYEKLFLEKSYIRQYDNRCPFLDISNKKYKDYLSSMGYKWGLKSKDKEIPSFIMKSDNDVAKLFLQSFFDAEGYTDKRSRGIGLTSASRKLIYQLSLLLQRFGIFCSFRKMMKCATNGTKIKRPYYELKILGSGMDKFMKEIGFSCSYKNENYLKFSEKKHNYNKEGKPAYIALKPFYEKYNIPCRLVSIPNEYFITGDRWANSDTIHKMIGGLVKLKEGKIEKEYSKLNRSKWTDKTTSTLKSVTKEDVENCIGLLETMADNDLQYEKIIFSEEIDYDGYIYDLSIKNYHNFISNNLICHNTNQTIVAADMRMKTNGGNTLIITLNATQEQWAGEIERFAQYKPNDISFDPNKLATWMVMTYPMFQTPKTREATTEKLQSYVREGKITCLILDECHSVKNTGAARTTNIQNISSFTDEKTGQEFSVPFVWGASATIVANRPVDVYNQLKVINHPLGKLSFGTFAQELGGMKKGRWGMEDAPIEEQVKAANKLKEWLINFGVYVARTKKDMKEDVPDLEIEDVEAHVDNVNLYNCIGAKVSGYEKPDLPISVMIATRDCLALSKAPHSLELAEPILKAGKKVMIFTAFKASAQHLINGLQRILDSMGNGGQVGSILGGMHRKTRLEYIQQFKDPNSPIKAMVLMIQAGGTGLDFPNVVDDVIENDFDWTPASNEQMRGRAWRITSKNPVKVKSVVAAGTEDEDFKSRVVEKINIADIIIKLTKEQLELFSLGNKYKDEKIVKRLDEIEKEMINAVKKETELEEGEGAFQQQMANQIREKIGGPIDKSIVAKNKSWYKSAKKK